MPKKQPHRTRGAQRFLIFKTLGVLVLLVGGINVADWYFYRHQNNPATRRTALPVATKHKPSANIAYSTDGKVSLTLSKDWRLLASSGNGAHIGKGTGGPCIDVDDPSPCAYEAMLQPKYVTDASDEIWYLTIEQTNWSTVQAAQSLLGDLTAQITLDTSAAPINHYDALYLKVKNAGGAVGEYVDVHYFLSYKNYLAHFSHRVQMDNGQERWNDASYSADFTAIVHSLKFNF